MGTAYSASKWALRGISQCWQAELRPQGIRVICVCPSEVQTASGGRVGRKNPNKLYAEDIAETVMATLSMHPRALVARAGSVRNEPLEGRTEPGGLSRPRRKSTFVRQGCVGRMAIRPAEMALAGSTGSA